MGTPGGGCGFAGRCAQSDRGQTGDGEKKSCFHKFSFRFTTKLHTGKWREFRSFERAALQYMPDNLCGLAGSF